jgi:hypothetical protein
MISRRIFLTIAAISYSALWTISFSPHDPHLKPKRSVSLLVFQMAGGFDTYSRAIAAIWANIGLPVQPIPGYKGTADIRLAAESGEIAGGCWQWESIKVMWRKGLGTGDTNLVLQLVDKAHPELANVPLAVSLAKTEEARTLLQAAVHDPNSITRPHSLPPGTHRRIASKFYKGVYGHYERSGVYRRHKKIPAGH